jgi:hypothetical protein
MKQMSILGSIKTTFGAAAIAAATVFAIGSTASPAYADATTVSASGGPCSVGSECVVTVIVKAGDGLHVNTEYNHKVTVTETAGAAFLGKTTATLFSKNDGDHEFRGEKVGVIKVRFKPSAKGKVSIAGTYKYATCSEGKGGGCTPGSSGFAVDVTVK